MTAAAILDQVYGRGDDDDGSGDAKRFENGEDGTSDFICQKDLVPLDDVTIC